MAVCLLSRACSTGSTPRVATIVRFLDLQSVDAMIQRYDSALLRHISALFPPQQSAEQSRLQLLLLVHIPCTALYKPVLNA